MKIKKISARGLDPISFFEVDDLDNIVIIAGANGSGKSRLKDAITQTFQNPSAPKVDLVIESTRDVEEEANWGTKFITLSTGVGNPHLKSYMDSRTRGGSYTGTVVQIDSQRSVQSVKFNPIDLSTPDPYDEETPATWYLSAFQNRWQEIVNKIFQRSANWKYHVADYVIGNPGETGTSAIRQYPDPIIAFQELFEKLLPGKTLDQIDPKQQREFQYTTFNGKKLSFNTLSSGEQEVIKITFDLLWKKMTHCVFLIDEPELHLHPTLSFRLVETLKAIGSGTNQFIFFTHSADLISTYYSTGNVFFIDSSTLNGDNQARRLSELDRSHSTLTRLMGHNLGLFAVGKKLLFVEGNNSSRDRLTYHSIAQKYYSEFQVIPLGQVSNIMALREFVDQIHSNIFGIDFFMLRDRDGLSDAGVSLLETNGRLKCLKRRCLENYFLDGDVLSKVADRFCISDTSFKNKSQVNAKLKSIAGDFINYNLLLFMKEYVNLNLDYDTPTIQSVEQLPTDQVIERFLTALDVSTTELKSKSTSADLRTLFEDHKQKLTTALSGSGWLDLFSGKEIFQKYCGQLGVDDSRVREAYTEIALKEKPEVFQDIIDIFTYFNGMAS
jgi:predicted ATPase